MTDQLSTAERGDGFLERRLLRVFDADLLRRVGTRDWTVVTLIVVLAQVSGVFRIDWEIFAPLVAIALGAIIFWAFFVRWIDPARVQAVLITLNVVAALAMAWLIHASGSPDSPYVLFFAVLMVGVANFVDSATARATLLAFIVVCSLGPIFHDLSTHAGNNFVTTMVVAAPVWLVMSALIIWKRTSTIRAELAARRLAYTDPLTGAANRRALREFTEELAATGHRYAFVLVRISGLTEINNTIGHVFGDEALQRVVLAMREASSPDDQVVRLSGATFAAVVVDADRTDSLAWCGRLRERLEIANAAAGDEAAVSATAGVTDTAGAVDRLIGAADAAAEQLVDGRTTLGHEELDESVRNERLGAQLQRQMAAVEPERPSSIAAPSGIWLSLPVALLLTAAIVSTGGADSALLSLLILPSTYFAVFGSRHEAIVGVLAMIVGGVVAVAWHPPLDSVQWARVVTVFATLLLINDVIWRNTRELADAERRTAELSLVDPLTVLPNRTAFKRDLIDLIERGGATGGQRRARIEGAPAIVIVEIGGFVGLRQRLGHAGTDLLLLEAGGVLRDTLSGIGRVYRVDSYRFGALFGSHHHQHVDTVAERCGEALNRLLTAERYAVGRALVRVCTGGATWSEPMTALDLLVRAEGQLSEGAGGAVEFDQALG